MVDLIKRNTPRIADQFVLKTIDSDNGYDCYEIYSEDKKVVLAGNSPLSQAMAYYDYLGRYHGVVITSGDYDISTISSAPLPEEKINRTIKRKIRAMTSYEAFSLSGNFRGFDRWEKEIDFMAMHGFNRALQPVGFDGVLFRTLTDIGMPENFCLEFSSGPAFLMNQLTGNIAGTNSVNSKEYLERKITVGKLISDRERSLGIEPIFPAAIPSVPFSLRKKYIKMDIFKAPMWHNFPPIFFIRPKNAFFSVFNKKFLTVQREALGETHSYIFEGVYESDKKGYNSHLADLGKALEEMLNEFDKDAVCYLHTSSINADFFKSCSGDKYIFLDDCEMSKNSDTLSDKKYIPEVSGNRYGRTGIYGNVQKLCDNPFANSELGGALAFDTFDINPVYCAAALKAITAADSFERDDFIRDFCTKRYKTDSFSDDIISLIDLCSSDECTGSIICARPCTNVKHTAPYDTMERSYDFHKLYPIAQRIINSEDKKIDAMRADIQSIVRQFLSDLAYPVYIKATEFFREKNVRNFEQASNLFLEICEDIDRLLKTREETNFCTKYVEAQELGSSQEEKESLQINFLLLHTIWGPFDHSILYDTVWNEWGGLVKDYYEARWHMYYRSLAAYFDNPKKLKDNSKKQPLDRNEYNGSYQAKRLALFENNFLENYIPRKNGIGEEDTVEVAKELLEKYSEVYTQF